MKKGMILALAAICIICSASLLTAQTITSNQTGTQNGWFYSFWNQGGGGSVSMTLGSGGNYSSSWSNCTNFTCGKGWKNGSADKVINYSGTFNGGSNGYLAAYGWTRNVLVEYYIVETYGQWTPPGGTSLGTVNSDGGTYNIYKMYRSNAPSIEGNNSNFDQFWSVRTSKRSSGTITCANHFNAWKAKGMNMGSTWDYLIMETEGYQSSGSSNVTISTDTTTTPPPTITPTPTATPTPTPTVVITPVPQQNPVFTGGPYELNGTSDYVDLPDGLTSNLIDFSVACWVKLNAATNWVRIFDFGGDSNVFMMLTPQSGTTGFPYFAITLNGNSGEQGLNGTAALPTGSWQHLAVVKSGNTGILYINKVEVARNTSMTLRPADLGNTTNNFIGKSQWTNDPLLNASVSTFVFYNRAISASEVTALGNAVPGNVGIAGDVNGDGSVTIVDAMLISQASTGQTPANYNAAKADVNCDNVVNVNDALLVARYVAGLVTKLGC